MVNAIVLWDDQPMAGPDVPARIVVTDDLRRSRLTVFFRLLLAIPHLVWVTLWGIAAFLVAIVNWFATLALGRSPGPIYRFLCGYVRYYAHVSAYVLLAANPFPGFLGEPGRYPVDVEIAPLAPQKRLKTLFRIVLAVPALILAGALRAGGGFAFSHGRNRYGGAVAGSNVSFGLLGIVAVLVWFSALARGRTPRGLQNTLAWGIGYVAQVSAYALVLTDRYPNSDPGATGVLGAQPAHPVRIRVEDDLRRSRVTVFFRLLLFIPHYVWLLLWGIPIILAVIGSWFVTLALGRTPRALHSFISSYVRYQTHVYAFVALIGNPFPGFLGRPGSYPIDLEIDGPERQHRLKTLFRLFLAVPAFFVSGNLTVVLWIVAFLGWFAALATGRMPTGFRNVGAWVLRYGAQTNAYLNLLTDRYPYSGPESGEAEPEADETTAQLAA
jgi:hypothetical protein